MSGISVTDPGLIRYISLQPRFLPKTGARYAGSKFHKSRINIVERLINKIMVSGHKSKKHKFSSGHNTGKAQTSMRIVQDAFKTIETKTKQNPVAVFVKAVENCAPREEIITIEYGGARYPKAVECAPQRRVDIVLRQLTQSTYQKSAGSKRAASDCLADEIMNAFNMKAESQAYSKKLELERAADSSR